MHYTKSFFLSLTTVFMLLSNLVQAATFQEGTDYTTLATPGKTASPNKIEVREFFWFGCPHCFQLESHLEKWKPSLAEDIQFVQTPSPINPSWMDHTHAFYVAEAIGKLDKISPALFKALHVKKQKVNDQAALAKFFTQFDVSEEQFNKLFNSFSIRMKVRKAESLSKSYQLRGVPAIVVNGKYLVKAGPSGKSHEYMLEVVDFLIEKERSGTKTSS